MTADLSRHCLDATARGWRGLCLPCADEERGLIQRAETESWLGSARARAAVLDQLYGGDGWYLARLHDFTQATGWVPHFDQRRHSCNRLLINARHKAGRDCDQTPEWPVEVDHKVLLTRAGQFAMLSQPYSVSDRDKPWKLDRPAPYGHGTHAVLVTPDNTIRPEKDAPWRPAPPFNCWQCNRLIGKGATHYLLHGVITQVCCVRCLTRHRAFDLVRASGTRAGIAHVLGLWPVELPVNRIIERPGP